MIGPDGANVPSPDQGLLGETEVSDLSDNLSATISGDTMKFAGDLKTITTPWAEFDKAGKNTGHFVPIQLPSSFVGNDYTMKGRTDGDRTVRIDGDRLLVVRLENLNTLTPYLEKDGEAVLKFDFTALVPTGEKARDAGKVDFGNFGRMDAYTDGLEIVWQGKKATARGTLKHYNGTDFSKVKTAGYYFPLGLIDWFEGVPHKAYINNDKVITEKDIVIKVENLEKPIKVEYCGMEVMQIDISGMTMGKA